MCEVLFCRYSYVNFIAQLYFVDAKDSKAPNSEATFENAIYGHSISATTKVYIYAFNVEYLPNLLTCAAISILLPGW